MKRILVPVDFSECSMAAAHAALAIASKAEAKIYFLHLQDDPGGIEHVPHTEQPVKQLDERRKATGNVKANLNKLVEQAEKTGVKASSVLVFTKGQEWIEDYIRPYKIDFVVMGSHGARGIKSAVVDSNAQHLILNTAVPVMVVKNWNENFTIKYITFASDFTIDVVKPFIPIIELANQWKATIHLLSVSTPNHFLETREALFNMKRFMHQFRKTSYCTHVYNALDEETGIHDFVQENRVDVIALTTHGRTGLRKVLTHSITESLINHEDVPLLIVNIRSLLQG